MNGPHDMGGMQCYGPLEIEVDEPYFHADWERKALALTVAMGFMGFWNLDASRFARESLAPVKYLSLSYYQIWLAALENLMLERSVVTEEEVATGKQCTPPKQGVREAPDREVTASILKQGGPTEREPVAPAKFKSGDRVRTIIHNPDSHTRLPRYARGKVGKILFLNGTHVFPDSNSKGEGEKPCQLYTVVFSAEELFGKGSHEVTLDLWEPYLTHVE